MIYFFIALIAIFICTPILLAAGKLRSDNTSKAYTDVTALMGVSIFMSIICSVIIALNADMPGSIGHGGFIYIIGPSFFGLAILIIYLVLVTFKPRLKFLTGVAGIMLNLLVGLMYFSGLLS